MSSMVEESEDLEDVYADVVDAKPKTANKFFASCGTCKASYIINPADLGEGRKVKCAVCANIWYQSSSKLQEFKVRPLASVPGSPSLHFHPAYT